MGMFRLKRITFSEEEKDNVKEKKSHPVLSTAIGGLTGAIGGSVIADKTTVQHELDRQNQEFRKKVKEKVREILSKEEEDNLWSQGKYDEISNIYTKYDKELAKNHKLDYKKLAKEGLKVRIPATLIGAGVGYAISRRKENKERN